MSHLQWKLARVAYRIGREDIGMIERVWHVRHVAPSGYAIKDAMPYPALESSLIGVAGVKPILVLMSRPWVTRFSSRSARGRRMMGSGGRDVSI